jgi:hypothetical protein
MRSRRDIEKISDIAWFSLIVIDLKTVEICWIFSASSVL